MQGEYKPNTPLIQGDIDPSNFGNGYEVEIRLHIRSDTKGEAIHYASMATAYLAELEQGTLGRRIAETEIWPVVVKDRPYTPDCFARDVEQIPGAFDAYLRKRTGETDERKEP